MSYVVGCRERAHKVLMICLKFPPSIGLEGTWCWGTCLCVNTCLVIQDWQPMVSLFWKITSCFFCFVLLKILPLLPPSCTPHWGQCWWSPETQTESLGRVLLVPSHHTQVAKFCSWAASGHMQSLLSSSKKEISIMITCHCTVSLSPNLPPLKFSSTSVFLWMLVLKQWISKWNIIGSEELTQANGTMMATGEFCLCQDCSASVWIINCIISLHALGHDDPSSGALRNNAFVSTSTVKPELWRLDTAPRSKIWHLVLHSEHCICWIT